MEELKIENSLEDCIENSLVMENMFQIWRLVKAMHNSSNECGTFRQMYSAHSRHSTNMFVNN